MSVQTTELSMSLCAALAAKEISDAIGCETTDALGRLLASQTGEELFDDDLKLWWEGPREIAALYLAEQGLAVPDEWA